jgi:hypothetical protein
VDSRKNNSVIVSVRPGAIVFPTVKAVSADIARMTDRFVRFGQSPTAFRPVEKGETDDGDRICST